MPAVPQLTYMFIPVSDQLHCWSPKWLFVVTPFSHTATLNTWKEHIWELGVGAESDGQRHSLSKGHYSTLFLLHFSKVDFHDLAFLNVHELLLWFIVFNYLCFVFVLEHVRGQCPPCWGKAFSSLLLSALQADWLSTSSLSSFLRFPVQVTNVCH